MSTRSEAVKKWRKKTKEKIVKSMGGECQICGYNTCIEALDLHHIDPSSKDLNFGSIMAHPQSWEKKIVPELRKCILLCANCHREVHYNDKKLPNIYSKFNETFLSKDFNMGDLIDECPECGRNKPLMNNYCSRSCSAKNSQLYSTMDNRFFLFKKENFIEDFKNLISQNCSIKKMAEFFNCSASTIKRYKKLFNKNKKLSEPENSTFT